MRRSLLAPRRDGIGLPVRPTVLPNRTPGPRAKLGDPKARSALHLGGRGEGERDDQPAARGVGRPDRRSVGLGDLPDDGQPEARAALRAPPRAAEEAVEQLAQLLVRRPGTVVADL